VQPIIKTIKVSVFYNSQICFVKCS